MCILGVFDSNPMRAPCNTQARCAKLVSCAPQQQSFSATAHTIHTLWVFVLLAQMDAEWRSVVGKNFIHPRPRWHPSTATQNWIQSFSICTASEIFQARAPSLWRICMRINNSLPILRGLVQNDQGILAKKRCTCVVCHSDAKIVVSVF